MDEYKKIYSIISIQDKKKTFYLFFLLLIGAFLEMMSIGSVLPLMSALIDVETSKEYLISLDIIKNDFNTNYLIYLFICIFFLIFFLKNLFLIYISRYETVFIADLSNNISTSIFKYYLSQNYSFFFNTNKADILKNITTEMQILSNGLKSFLVLFLESLVFLFLCMFLLILNVKIFTLIIISFLILSFFFIKITKKKFLKWGEQRSEYDFLRIKQINEVFSSIRELILSKEYKKTFNKFNDINKEYYLSIGKKNFVQSLPKYLIEFLAILIITIFLIDVTNQNKNISLYIPTIAVYIAGAFKLLPTINKIINAKQQIKFMKTILDNVHRSIIKNNFNKSPINFDNISKLSLKESIRFFNVSFGYNDDSLFIKDFNFEIKKGDCIGIIGKSGQGKTTIIDLISGLIKPIKGKVMIDNLDINNSNRLMHSWQKSIGYVGQSIYLNDVSLLQNITSGKNDDFSKKKYLTIIEVVDLNSLKLNIGYNLENVGEDAIKLSGGQKQRIAIARALFNEPSLLILDEATNAIDIPTESKILKNIRSYYKDLTIIIISHRKETLGIANKIISFKDNKITLNTKN